MSPLYDSSRVVRKPGLDYLTAAERAMFRDLVKRGGINFWRIGTCKHCGEDVPKAKDYCSRDCAERAKGDSDVEESTGEG